MSEHEHTPGPWEIGKTDHIGRITVRAGAVPITQMYGDPARPERQKANAHLIAAAPLMLEALAALRESGLLQTLIDMDEAMIEDGDDPITAPVVEKIDAALASARGEK